MEYSTPLCFSLVTMLMIWVIIQEPNDHCCYINEVVEPLEVVFIGHTILAKRVDVGFGFTEGQGKKLLVFEAKFHCLDYF